MWPQNVGILAIELIFPSQFVDQNELEKYDEAPAGKYTIGLGQKRMGFCSDREDINSICLTVVKRLLERHGIAPQDIGRLEVGTETLVDKSKSVKSVLMQLFEPYGVTDLEGIDMTNACYGGTAALLNACNWIESSSWNGRLALVVAGDIAVYAKGPARPTGGMGAVAMLVGPDAPLVIDRGVRATYVKHAYDFYKPDLTSEYPTVDGKLSIECYLSALDHCYQLYCSNVMKKSKATVNLGYFDAVLFHSPFCKLVQKSLARLCLNDYLSLSNEDQQKLYPHNLSNFSSVNLTDTYFNRDIEKAFINETSEVFKIKTNPSLLLASQVGNMYTASLYGGLVSYLISKDISQLAGDKVGLFSYGSGLAATFFSISVSNDTNSDSKLAKLVNNLRHIQPLLDQRQKISPEKFEASLELRKNNSHKAPLEPSGSTDHFFPGTYYLARIDEKYRRFYERVPLATNGHV